MGGRDRGGAFCCDTAGDDPQEECDGECGQGGAQFFGWPCSELMIGKVVEMNDMTGWNENFEI